MLIDWPYRGPTNEDNLLLRLSNISNLGSSVHTYSPVLSLH
jgi:hypothetical protein